MLQLVPEPLPPMSAASHDEELDVTLDPECAPEGEEPGTSVTEAPGGQPIRDQHVIRSDGAAVIFSLVFWQILADGL